MRLLHKNNMHVRAELTQRKLDHYASGLSLSDVKCVASQHRSDGPTTCVAILNDGREVVLYG